MSRGARGGRQGTTDGETELFSLPQALGVAPLLLARCSEWAARFRGSLEALDAGPGLDASSASQGLGTPQAVPGSPEWWAGRAGLKLPARAAEKAVVCYGGDASRLLDVCRARIAFDSLADLVACLEAIVCNSPGSESVSCSAEFGSRPENSDLGPPGGVIVVRVRNGLSLAHNSRSTAGYRVRAHGVD